MAALREESARLPSGQYFETWETEQIYDRVLHVSAEVSASGDGSAEHPFKTISEAAEIATPGTRVLIHAGTYRETVRPARGGESPERMISYEAAGDGEAIIKASIVAEGFSRSTDWLLYRGFGNMNVPPEEEQPRIWQYKLNPDDYRGYNPFCAVNILHDRLFIEFGKTDMTTYLNRRGMIFVDGKPLQQVALYNQMNAIPGSYWVEANGQTVHFRMPEDDDPNNHIIEMTCREQCFAPDVPYLQYIKVKGLTCAHAATGAPVPQRGSISCFRGSHWIIEDCTIDWSNGVGIDIGCECWHRKDEFTHSFGHTIIRRNKIYDVGVCGIAGMSACYLLIEDNLIQGTGWQKMELSWEAGGIKVHNCVDSVYRRNIFSKTIRCDALWMDCGNENNRITQNLFLDGLHAREAIFMECSRGGENLFDNNIIWNVEGRFNEADVKVTAGSASWYAMGEDGSIINGYGIYGEGTDYLRMSGNLIGKCRSAGYFQKTVAFRLSGRGGTARDAKFYGNIFYSCGEAAIKMPTDKNESEGNVFMKMPSGFLRILYPAPTECLDLKTWREFHGFDMTGAEADFDIDIDTDAYTMTIRKAAPFNGPQSRRRLTGVQLHDPAELPKIKTDEKVKIDFFGNDAASERIAGPFAELYDGMTVSIDPRKL